MIVGVNAAVELKKKSEELKIPFSNLLFIFAEEELLARICESSFGECLLLLEGDVPTTEKEGIQIGKRLSFYYKESERRIAPEKQVAGQVLSEALLEVLCRELTGKNGEVEWEYSYEMDGDCANLSLSATYCDMQVPLRVRLLSVKENFCRIKRLELCPLMGQKPFTLLVYAPRNRLGENVVEIMEKLELVSDMSCYDAVNEVLRAESVSGRRMMEDLGRLVEGREALLRLKRLEQLEGYRSYKYMEKRWEKYRKAHRREDDWQTVLARLLCFVGPIWTALCKDEIFFDDWMPELGRYLG